MSRIDASPRTPGQVAWAVWLAALALAGAWTLAAVPPWLLRGHWDTSLLWMFALACAGVAAEAAWNGRAHRRAASLGVVWAVPILWLLVLTAPDPSAVPGVSFAVLVPLSASLYPLLRSVADPL